MLDITRSALHFLEVMLDFQKLLFLAVQAFLVEFSPTEERGQGGRQRGREGLSPSLSAGPGLAKAGARSPCSSSPSLCSPLGPLHAAW